MSPHPDQALRPPPLPPSKPGHVRQDGNGDADGQGKPSNPKDLVGMTKSPLSIVPSTLVVCCANALLEGALKYGRYNWRIAGVRASIYMDAIGRHQAKWWNGQDKDPKSLVHHLDNAIAGLTILRDAMLYNKLEDDRPPCPDPDAMADLIDAQGELIAHLKAEFKAHQPYQFTIADTPRPSIQAGRNDQEDPTRSV